MDFQIASDTLGPRFDALGCVPALGSEPEFRCAKSRSDPTACAVCAACAAMPVASFCALTEAFSPSISYRPRCLVLPPPSLWDRVGVRASGAGGRRMDCCVASQHQHKPINSAPNQTQPQPQPQPQPPLSLLHSLSFHCPQRLFSTCTNSSPTVCCSTSALPVCLANA